MDQESTKESTKLSICDTEVQNGEVVVVNQRDFNVPNFCAKEVERLCVSLKQNRCCDEDCKRCLITRLLEVVYLNNY